jgi:hypothetical protein
MAIPPTAKSFGRVLDPHEEKDYGINLGLLLQPGEEIDSYELTLLPEAVAAGLEIMEGEGRDHALFLDNTGVKFWLTIADEEKTNAIFDGAGASLPLEITVVTDSTPPRTRQRTFLATVAHL